MYVLRKHKKKIFFSVALVFILTYTNKFTNFRIASAHQNLKFQHPSPEVAKKSFKLEDFLVPKQSEEQKKWCRLPELELTGHTNIDQPVDCSMKEEWGFLRANKWRLNSTVISKLVATPECKYRNITRLDDDFKLQFSNYSDLKNGQTITHEVIEVDCVSGNEHFNNLYVQIVDKLTDPATNIKPPMGGNNSCQPLNILLLSYDSMSRVSWLKRLPLSSQLILNQMNFDLLYGFNIIGDGTPACMIPLLTGATEAELPSTLKSNPQGNYVDQVYPFIWHDLHEKGYVSFHMEDWPQVSAFTYRLRGMSNRTAHHYMRAYQLALWKRVSGAYFSGQDDLCIGATKRHKRALDLVSEFVRMYNGRGHPFIAILHYIENSHDGNSRANQIDTHLVQFLDKAFRPGNGFGSNTAVFIYSDHGARFAAERQTSQGDLEERLPFFAIRLPDWYKQAHPDKYQNLLTNTQQLTTPFDIYATLRELSCLETNGRTNKTRSQSLLSEISPNRSCKEVGVSMHYCVCQMNWRGAGIQMKVSRVAVKFVMDYINKHLLSHVSQHCVELKLFEFNEVKYATLTHGRNETYLRLNFVTTPNRANYAALVKLDHKSGFSIDSPASISRINAYGTQSSCLESVQSDQPELLVDLRKFCFCRKYLRPGTIGVNKS